MTTTTDHQHGFISHAYSRDGNLRPALITARHWEDGDFEIVIRPLSRPHHLIILDRDDINAVNGLLRAQPAIPTDSFPVPATEVHHIHPSDTPSYQLTEHWQRIDELTSGMIALEERLHTLTGALRAQATEIGDLRSRLARAESMESYYDAELTRRLLIRDKRLTKLETNVRALIAQAVRALIAQAGQVEAVAQ